MSEGAWFKTSLIFLINPDLLPIGRKKSVAH